MAVEVTWLNADKTIVLQHFSGAWKLEDYYLAVDQSANLLRTVPQMVDLIIDLTGSQMNSTNLLAGATNAERKLPANQGLVVVVAAPSYIKLLVDVARKIAPRATQHVRFVENRGQALEQIVQTRAARVESDPA